MRRVIMDRACKYCKSINGQIEFKEPHNKLSCGECGKYIKFISDSDAAFLEWVDKESAPKQQNNSTIQEINFKLDLVLDHLGIKNRQ